MGHSTQRRGFFAYLNFNLPRVTKTIFVLVIAFLGLAQWANVAYSADPFPAGTIVMAVLLGGCVLFVGLALFTKTRPWTFGLAICVVTALVYVIGLLVDAPTIRAGSSTGRVALWNLNILVPAGYFVLYWALRRGIVVAHPDQRHWHD